MRKSIQVWALAIVTVTLMASPSWGAVMTYQQGAFGYTHDGSRAQQNNANGIHNPGYPLVVGSLFGFVSGQPGGRTRSYLGYDLTGIPNNAAIQSITLALTVTENAGGFASSTIDIHRITAAGDIDETGLSWNQYDTGLNWGTAGGDFSATIVSSSATNQSSGVQTWLSTPAFVTAAQDALDNDGGRLEFLLLAPVAETFDGVRYRAFRSNDNDVLLAERPLLTVTYEIVPEPASAGLLAIGGMILLRRKR